jgi:hypothetical protein
MYEVPIREKDHSDHNTHVEGANHTEGGGVRQGTHLPWKRYRKHQEKLKHINEDESLQYRWWPRTIHPTRSGPTIGVGSHEARNSRGSLEATPFVAR